MKEHDLPAQRPMGWGQRRRSSILEKLARETTKEGKRRARVSRDYEVDGRAKYDSLLALSMDELGRGVQGYV